MGVIGIHTYDSISGKWKSIRPKIDQFCSTYISVVRKSENGVNDEHFLQKAINEYVDEYGTHFNLHHVWRILKDSQGGFNLNNVVDEYEEEEKVQEVRSIGRDKSKKKLAIYVTEKKKSLTTAIPLSTAFFSNSIVEDFQDSLDDEEDTRSSQEYMDDSEMEFHKRALLTKSKGFFKKGTQRFNDAKANDKTECFKCGASTSTSTQVRNQGFVAEAYEWDEEEVLSDDNEMVEVKVIMALVDDESGAMGKESVRNREWVKISIRKVNRCISEQMPNQKRKILGADQLSEDTSSSGQKYLVFIKSSFVDNNVSKINVKRSWFSKAEGLILTNYDTGRILPPESQVNVTDSSVTDYDSAKESASVCSTPFPLLEKLPTPANGNKNVPTSKKHSALIGKLKDVKTEVDIHMKPIWYLDSGCSRHMTGVKSYLHKYVEQPGAKVFDEKRGIIFNFNKDVAMIAPRVRDVYVLNMTSSALESCFFAKASERKERTKAKNAKKYAAHFTMYAALPIEFKN
ncbi:hypothetical protein Tco_1109766 [Tanacetum coccineum]|uniref:Uncharacterized protein n=1 Tax=Tanacetum coccineum TaxID=301880 RepID=A0ABQ5IJC0_9ASTR